MNPSTHLDRGPGQAPWKIRKGGGECGASAAAGRFLGRLAILLAAAAGWMGAMREGRAAEAGDGLFAGFRSPPAAARPWVYWFWMDGNVSREGITADLEAMRRAGLGGMVLMEVDVGVPRGPVKFMSPEWMTLFGHAAKEAERLGLEITLNAGPGWTGSGGPWVAAEQSMQHLVAAELSVTGPTNLAVILPRPVPREPHFVHVPLPPGVKAARDGFYRDVALVAFPTPADGPRIAEVDEKALYYRLPFSSHPGVRAGLPAPADYPALPEGAAIARGAVVDLTDRLQPDGRVAWSVPAGRWTLVRFGRASTGANTRPAPEPGIGLESDKFDPAALDAHFAAFVDPLLRVIGRGEPLTEAYQPRSAGWTMLHIDSWEMGAQNWTGRYREEFRRRRGYDPLTYLPAMTGRPVESLEISERFLWDVRQTAQELVIENHAGHLKELGHRRGLGLSIEPYDMNPCADLSLGGVADVPMCEFWSDGYGFDTAFSCFEAVSIAHTRGRRVVAAEAFTATDQEAWRLYPGAMKAQADWAFATGINRLVIHRYAHQPWLDRRPGMTMGPYGVHHDRTQTWWEMSGAWHEYLARCQFLLRQGLPVADILYVAPEGAPQVFRPPPSALAGRAPVPDRRGYGFDGCAPETVRSDLSVRDGRLVLPDGTSYRLLVLPERETMTAELLEKVAALVRDGATVLGPPPRKSPGLAGYPDCDRRVRELAELLWGPEGERKPGAERVVGRGRVVHSELPPGSTNLFASYESAVSVLERMGVPPDFEGHGALRYAHRRLAEADLYFVGNNSGKAIRPPVRFRVTGRVPEIWDPVTGRRRPVPGLAEAGGRTEFLLDLEKDGSCFVVFRDRSVALPESGSGLAKMVDALPARVVGPKVDGPWEVTFPADGGGPGAVRFEALDSWPERAEAGVRYFSGTAVYRRTLALPAAGRPAEGARWFLDLGRVEVMARVRLNGADLGVAWHPPFRVDITEAARPGANQLEIEVANLWPNRLIGDQARPVAERVTWSTWNPYRKDSPLLPSGLLGPVQVLEIGAGANPAGAEVAPEGAR